MKNSLEKAIFMVGLIGFLIVLGVLGIAATPWENTVPKGAIVQDLGPGCQRIAFNNHTYLRHYWPGHETIVPMETGK